MGGLSKRMIVYFDPEVYQALLIRAETSNVSLSETVDEAVRLLLREDAADLADMAARADEPEMSYAALLRELNG